MSTSGAVLIKAGADVSTDISDGVQGLSGDDIISQFINEAEAYVCAQTRYDWTANYGSLAANYKNILNETVSNLAAIYCIEYDLDAIGRSAAMSKINVLWARIDKNIQFLKDTEKTDAIKGV